MTKKELEEEIKRAEKKLETQERLVKQEQEEIKKQIKTFTKIAWFFVWVGVVVTFVGLALYLGLHKEEGFSLNLLGDFMAGTVASLWGLAGLFFIYVAFLGQRQQISGQELELKYSRLEVKYTRLELQGQKEEMALQNDTLKIQRFESTFFELIKVHHEIIDKISYRDGSSQFTGRSGLSRIKNELWSELGRSKRDYVKRTGITYSKVENELNQDLSGSLTAVQTAYKNFWRTHQAHLSHHMRNLYHCFKYIWISENSIEKKKEYASLLRAQISPDEYYIIFFNSMVDGLGNPKFLYLIRELNILKNIDRTHIEAWQWMVFEKLLPEVECPFD